MIENPALSFTTKVGYSHRGAPETTSPGEGANQGPGNDKQRCRSSTTTGDSSRQKHIITVRIINTSVCLHPPILSQQQCYSGIKYSPTDNYTRTNYIDTRERAFTRGRFIISSSGFSHQSLGPQVHLHKFRPQRFSLILTCSSGLQTAPYT